MIKIIRHFYQLDLQRIKIIPSVGKVMGKWSSHIEGHVNLAQLFWIQFGNTYQKP